MDDIITMETLSSTRFTKEKILKIILKKILTEYINFLNIIDQILNQIIIIIWVETFNLLEDFQKVIFNIFVNLKVNIIQSQSIQLSNISI